MKLEGKKSEKKIGEANIINKRQIRGRAFGKGFAGGKNAFKTKKRYALKFGTIAHLSDLSQARKAVLKLETHFTK